MQAHIIVHQSTVVIRPLQPRCRRNVGFCTGFRLQQVSKCRSCYSVASPLRCWSSGHAIQELHYQISIDSHVRTLVQFFYIYTYVYKQCSNFIRAKYDVVYDVTWSTDFTMAGLLRVPHYRHSGENSRRTGPEEGIDNLLLVPESVLDMDGNQLRDDLNGLRFAFQKQYLQADLGPQGNIWICKVHDDIYYFIVLHVCFYNNYAKLQFYIINIIIYCFVTVVVF